MLVQQRLSADLPQQPVCKDQEFLRNREMNCLDQEEPKLTEIKEEQDGSEPPWIKEEEVTLDQFLCKQERSSALNKRRSEQVKEEQEELCIGQEEQKLDLKQDTDMMVQCKSESGETSRVFENTIIQYEEQTDHQHKLLESDTTLHVIDLPQQHVCEKQEVLSDQQLWNQQWSSSLDQEEPEPPQIKEDQEELCSSQEGEQLVVKQETDTFMWTPTDQERDFSSLNSPLTGRRNQEQRKNLDSESTSEVEVDPNKGRHRNRSDSENEDRSPQPQSRVDTESGRKSAKCDVCGKAFRDKHDMERHYRVHTGVKPYDCKTCGKVFTRKYNLRKHALIHTGDRPYSCETCGKCFSGSYPLAVHMRSHTDEKPFSCRVCGEHFRLRSILSGHMETHTGEKPFSCRTCGKDFLKSHNLLTHMRTHTGERPYSCGICGKDFTRKCHLKSHMSFHTGEKMYSCDMCRRRFRNRSNMTRHMRICTAESIS